MEAITGKLLLKERRDRPIRNRHPWVFSGAISRIDGQPAPGDLVSVHDSHGRYLATGYFNPASQIRARLLTWDPHQAVDESFWRSLIERAIASRVALELDQNCNAYRLIHAEADGMPGLVVDRYDQYLVVQCLTLGIDRRKQIWVDLLVELLLPQGILERSDVAVRQKEGLESRKELLWGAEAPAKLKIRENDLKFFVNMWEGHKTGFYLDQRDNRALLGQSHLVSGKRMLNVFAYTGGFSAYAAVGGAKQIINIDSSIQALELAEQNMALNNFERPSDEYIAGDAFEILRYYRDRGEHFDVIILDPPKFAHGKRDIERASRGYKDLNLLALRLLRYGGLLATFSCSGKITVDLFQKIVFGAAVDAQRNVQIIQTLGQSADHPILLTFPESAYLKGLLCRVW
ncbi:MAG: 23S rRNA (cytosine(1962)-C(5))-methyltransferase RlmI [Chloroflexi bacterium]|jgi:23S rRNA (cytosine1962-C5)-methyltransferase|nr:23S rRNA (cytosine(1962)-C(5))-methyltransferase RlmI [Chloroflexota bacterium]